MEHDEYQLERMAFAEGYDDAYEHFGENLNPFDEEFQSIQWKGYEKGYNQGLDKLIEETAGET